MTFAKDGNRDTDAAAGPLLGVYVHFPWCLQKCPYCDFLSIATHDRQIPHSAYADAVIKEIERRRSKLGSHRLHSVFVGGGTPSLWEPAELGRVLAAIDRAWTPSPETTEVTVECNPSSLDTSRARALAEVGVNRLSVGVQGLDDERLKFLGRLHDARSALRAVGAALKAPRTRVSADVIFGVAGQSAEEARDEVAQIADLGITHLSAYALTIEPNTRFGALARRGRLPLLGDDAQAEAFVEIERTLEARGFQHYEISNYAKPGEMCRHNLGYWRGQDYLGLGCGAWGTLSDARTNGKESPKLGEAVRYRNTPNPDRYLEMDWGNVDLSGPSEAVAEQEVLSAETRLKERIMLGLRLSEGVDLEREGERLGVDPWTRKRRSAAERLVDTGRLIATGGRLRIPKEQWLFADGIAADLM